MDIIQYIRSFPLQSFSKDEILLSPGNTNNSLYAIRDGFVKVTSIDDLGRQKLLWVAGRYDVVPVENLFSKSDVSYFYTAFSEGSMYVIDKRDFINKAKSNVEFMTQIAQGLSEHYDNLLGRLNGIEQSDLRTKLLHILHNLSTKFDNASVVRLHKLGLNLTHQDIADMVGATREATSIELKKMRKEGLIYYTRSTFTVFADVISEELNTPT
jgi:CRP/FNR family transcriptional regulator